MPAIKQKSLKPTNKPSLTLTAKPDETANVLAQMALTPSTQAAITLHQYDKVFGDLALDKLIACLKEQVQRVKKGDLSRAEAMLISQAHTLDAIFNNLSQRAIRTEYLNQFESYLRLALKAQTQCRATLETLSVIKNPPKVAFVRQANIAHNQQVNNADASRAQENENLQNELLEQADGQRLEFGTQSEASLADPAMATVGEVYRPEDGRG